MLSVVVNSLSRTWLRSRLRKMLGRARVCRVAAISASVAMALPVFSTIHGSSTAHALAIEITGGGADRLDRQRAWAEGELPLPGTPDLGKLQERLSAAGLREGAPVFVRIFKSESELELWMQKGQDFVLFATYPICQWSGILGPKFYEGDNQSPEGFYVVGRRDLKWQTRHHRAFNIGFPNAYDKLQGRTGSNILVHGGCSTEGCFAMTNPVIDEVFRLANSAIASGQREFQVHVFPFRMTATTLMQHSSSPWLDFWINMKTGYDLFAETRVPPSIRICKNRYSYDRVPEFGPIGPEQECNPTNAEPAATDETTTGGGNVVTTGSVRATSARPPAGLRAAEDRRVPKRTARDRGRSRDSVPAADSARDVPTLPAVPSPLMGTELLPQPSAPVAPPSTFAASQTTAPTPVRVASQASASLAKPGFAGRGELTAACHIGRSSCRKWTAAHARLGIERSRLAHSERKGRTRSASAASRH